jgi:hypothetical protein
MMAMKLTRNNTVRLMALSLKRYSEFCSVILKKAIATRIVDIPKAIEIARNNICRLISVSLGLPAIKAPAAKTNGIRMEKN